MMMSGPALVSMAEAIRGLRSFMLIWSTVTSTPASLPNSPASRLNSTSEAGTKLTHSRMLSLVPFGKLGAFCAATIPGMPPTTAVAAAAAPRKARRFMLVAPLDLAMVLTPRAGRMGRNAGITALATDLVKCRSRLGARRPWALRKRRTAEPPADDEIAEGQRLPGQTLPADAQQEQDQDQRKRRAE